MSENLPGGYIKVFGLYHGGEQIGFQCFAEYTPWTDKNERRILHSNRTVIHPDYVGFGLGMKIIDVTSQLMLEQNHRVMAKYSALPVFKSMSKNPKWRLLDSGISTPNAGGSMQRKSSFRQKVKWWSFEFTGEEKI